MKGMEHAPHADEARERWEQTDAYKESAQRTKSYKPDDWARIKAESEAINDEMADLMKSGAPADGAAALALAERARMHIDRWFYPCSHRMHAGLADMYTADPRFAASYDDRAEGLSVFVSDAIKANSAKHAE